MRLIAQPNAGPSTARNRGIAAARGDYVAFLDSDDLWAPGKLETQIEVFRRHPEAGLVFGDCRIFDETGPRTRSFFEHAGLDAGFFGDPALVKDPYTKLFRVNYVPTGAAMVRKACLRVTGTFDDSRRYVEDMDLWFRLALHFPVAYTSHLCQLKRQHGGCVSNNAEVMTMAYLEVIAQQRRLHGAQMKIRGIRTGPRVALVCCLLGDLCGREGRNGDARRWYLKAVLSHPSPRSAVHLLRSLWGRRQGDEA